MWSQSSRSSGFLTPPTAEGQAVGAVSQVKVPVSQSKHDLIEDCPDVVVKVNGCPIPFLLDTGSQVTLMSKSLFTKFLEGTVQPNNTDSISWLRLYAANGLEIPYVGYAMVDCMVEGIHVPGKGIIIVSDEHMGPAKGILGMNIIKPVWSALSQVSHPGLMAFKSTMSIAAGQAWDRAFTDCRQIAVRDALPPYHGVAKLPRQQPSRKKISIPPLWLRWHGGPS